MYRIYKNGQKGVKKAIKVPKNQQKTHTNTKAKLPIFMNILDIIKQEQTP